MKRKLFIILPVLAMLTSCGNGSNGSYKPGREYGDDKIYALFMYNYPRGESVSPNGYDEMVENTLYFKEEIVVGELIAKPAEDPIRENYDFKGWYIDKEGEDAWNFATDRAQGSTILYAKWGTGSEVLPYVEPEYIPPERIIDDMDFRITDILNKPTAVAGTQVNLTAGGINRLKKHSNDVKFAIGFEHRANISLSSATYNASSMEITATFSNGQSQTIKVNDITASLAINNSYYETKAKNYEAKGEDIENYHIALMGSSSMENWDTSTEDMDPIV